MRRLDQAPWTVMLLLCLAGAADAQGTPPAPAVVTPAPGPGTAPAPSGDSLTGAAAWERLKGNTITGKTAGGPFSQYFDASRGVRYVDKDGLSVGSWTVHDDKVCFDFPDDDDRSCSTFSVTGSTGAAVDDDGQTTRFVIEPGNSKGL